MEKRRCCFIGHRTIDISNELHNRLFYIIEDLICVHNVTYFLFGSRSQFNDFCFDIVTELKDKYPQIKRVAYNTRSECVVLEKDREQEEASLANFLHRDVYLQGFEESITPDKMYLSGKASYVERNQIMIDNSDFCVFYYDNSYSPSQKCISNKCVTGIWTSGNSGTKIAYKYALQKKKTIINVFQKGQ